MVLVERTRGGRDRRVRLLTPDQTARSCEVEVLVMLEPAAGGELRENADCEQDEADGEGADNPVQLHTALEHEPVEQSQHKNQNGRLGEERGTTRRRDGDEIEERGGTLFEDRCA